MNAFGKAANFVSGPKPSFHSGVNSSTGRDARSFTRKEQAIFHRAGKLVTQAIRMSSRGTVASTNEWMFRPMVIDVIHE